jgi:hypothetical protein
MVEIWEVKVCVEKAKNSRHFTGMATLYSPDGKTLMTSAAIASHENRVVSQCLIDVVELLVEAMPGSATPAEKARE